MKVPQAIQRMKKDLLNALNEEHEKYFNKWHVCWNQSVDYFKKGINMTCSKKVLKFHNQPLYIGQLGYRTKFKETV